MRNTRSARCKQVTSFWFQSEVLTPVIFSPYKKADLEQQVFNDILLSSEILNTLYDVLLNPCYLTLIIVFNKFLCFVYRQQHCIMHVRPVVDVTLLNTD